MSQQQSGSGREVGSERGARLGAAASIHRFLDVVSWIWRPLASQPDISAAEDVVDPHAAPVARTTSWIGNELSNRPVDGTDASPRTDARRLPLPKPCPKCGEPMDHQPAEKEDRENCVFARGPQWACVPCGHLEDAL